MEVKNLSNIPFEDIMACFLAAFEGYFVQMPTEKAYYQRRWKAAKVDFDQSYGMFDKGRLVGFIINAIDKRNGILTAFNTGTGVIPEYRGKRIVKSIYAHAIGELRQQGVEKSTLEVITKNDIAIRSYKSIGFSIYKHYKCFKGSIVSSAVHPELREIAIEKTDWSGLPNQHRYSWDNQKESIKRGTYRFFQVLHKKKPESFFVINNDGDYLAQFDLLNDDDNGWERLFSGISQISDTIKINNVDGRLEKKLNYLGKIGLENTVDQYEMELNLNGSKS